MPPALNIPPPGSQNPRLDQQTPVTVVTGFLGSGKTTLISHWIDQLQDQGLKISYLKNEEGATSIDTKLIQGTYVTSQELLNGCICCTLMGPFLSAIDEIIDTHHPDRIIVESSGTAEPANFAVTLSGHPRVFRDGVINIVDSANFQAIDQLRDIYQIQTKMTDLIVLNKLELIDDQRKQSIIDIIRNLNDYSPIIEAHQGQVDPRLIFGIQLQDITQFQSDHHHDNEHFHPDEYVFVSDTIFDKAVLVEKLKQLPPEIIRVKGLVQFADQTQILNGAYRRFDFFTPPTPVTTQTQLLFIAYQSPNLKEQVESLFGG